MTPLGVPVEPEVKMTYARSPAQCPGQLAGALVELAIGHRASPAIDGHRFGRVFRARPHELGHGLRISGPCFRAVERGEFPSFSRGQDV
jgi:hypothetical protein